MLPHGKQLVLASRSPQRRAILAELGVPFTVRPSDYPERESGNAAEVALENALGKAAAVARGAGELVLGVDTVVSLDGRLWGKPADRAVAEATLRALSGREHVVVSGLAVVGDADNRQTTCLTRVRFRPLDETMLAWYLTGEEWRERAGGYAIQGAGCALVESICGDYTNVVGLPVGSLLELLPELLSQQCVHPGRSG